jgi:hypothetical protein
VQASSGMLRHVALVRTDVSEEINASIIRVTRISWNNQSTCAVSPYVFFALPRQRFGKIHLLLLSNEKIPSEKGS